MDSTKVMPQEPLHAVTGSSRRQHALSLRELFDEERRRSQAATMLAHKTVSLSYAGDGEESESGVWKLL